MFQFLSMVGLPGLVRKIQLLKSCVKLFNADGIENLDEFYISVQDEFTVQGVFHEDRVLVLELMQSWVVCHGQEVHQEISKRKQWMRSMYW